MRKLYERVELLKIEHRRALLCCEQKYSYLHIWDTILLPPHAFAAHCPTCSAGIPPSPPRRWQFGVTLRCHTLHNITDDHAGQGTCFHFTPYQIGYQATRPTGAIDSNTVSHVTSQSHRHRHVARPPPNHARERGERVGRERGNAAAANQPSQSLSLPGASAFMRHGGDAILRSITVVFIRAHCPPVISPFIPPFFTPHWTVILRLSACRSTFILPALEKRAPFITYYHYRHLDETFHAPASLHISYGFIPGCRHIIYRRCLAIIHARAWLPPYLSGGYAYRVISYICYWI